MMSDRKLVVGVNGQAEYVPMSEADIAQRTADAANPLVERVAVPKSLVLSRLTDAQLDAALAAMTNRQRERWRAPDKPAVYADDPEVIALLKAIGADPSEVLKP